MASFDSKHPANQLHPSYVADKKARALSLAFREGTPAFRRDWKEKRRRWMKPAEGELETVRDPEYTRGQAVFDVRMETYRTSNDYGDSLRTSATQPFDYAPVFDGWDSATEARLRGEGIGLDGSGSSMREMHAAAYLSKLFAGLHLIRIDVGEGVPLWTQTDADALLNWRMRLTTDGRVLSYANVEIGRDDEGKLRRCVYELTSEGVAWQVYRSIGELELTISTLDPDLRIAAYSWEAADSGLMRGLWSVPVEPFAMFWNTPYRSPVPFADAAEIQLAADVHESLLGSYRRRVSNSPVLAVSQGDLAAAGGPGYGSKTTDENAQPRPLHTSGGALRLYSDSARASWEALDTQHIPQETEKLEKEYEKVRRKCQDPLLAVYRGGPTTAMEVGVTDARSMSWLRLAALADVKSLRRLAGYTAFMSGSSADGNIAIRLSKSAREKTELVDRVQEQAKEGLVGKRVVWKVSAENLVGYPTEEEVEELSREAVDPPPDAPST